MKLISSTLIILFFCSGMLLFAQEENHPAPIVSGKIIDKIDLASPTNPVIYLIVQDSEGKVWSCKMEDNQSLQEVKAYKKDDSVDIYGVLIDKEARQIEVEKVLLKK